MYAQVYTRPDISFSVDILSHYQTNPVIDTGKTFLRYIDHLEVVGYTDSDYGGCVDTRRNNFDYVFVLAGGAIS
ncbi:hypothetical protein V2J09_005483 [Rumex salicifolius]